MAEKKKLRDALRKRAEIVTGVKPLEVALTGSELEWQPWLAKYFPHVATAPFAERHVRLWEWFDALKPSDQPRPRIEIWPRGGAKSSTGELGCVRSCVKLSRRFVLYVSGTQEKQANPHVQAIGGHLERIGVERALNNYGNSRGWTVNLLRTANGFNVAALGLDAASRGVKLDQYRPDLIILDDIDDLNDSRATVEKKVRIITTSILPTGSPDCAVLGLQNLIRPDGVFGLLQSGEADFLHNREPVFMEPAVHGLHVEPEPREDGGKFYRILAGTATWRVQARSAARSRRCRRRILQGFYAGADRAGRCAGFAVGVSGGGSCSDRERRRSYLVGHVGPGEERHLLRYGGHSRAVVVGEGATGYHARQ